MLYRAIIIALATTLLSLGCRGSSTTEPSTEPSTRKGGDLKINSEADLEKHLGERVTLQGSAVPRKAGPWLQCKGFAVEILNQKPWPSSVEEQKVEVSGQLQKVHQEDVKVDRNAPQVPRVGGGTWYALDNVEWKVIDKP